MQEEIRRPRDKSKKHNTCDHYEQALISLHTKPSKRDRSIALDKYVFGDFRYNKRGRNVLEPQEYSSEAFLHSSSDDEDDTTKKKEREMEGNEIDDSEGPPGDADLNASDSEELSDGFSEGDLTDDINGKPDSGNVQETDVTEMEKKRYRVNKPLWYDSKQRSSSSEDAEFVYNFDDDMEEEEEEESESSEGPSSHGEFDEEIWKFAKLTREIEKQNAKIAKEAEETEEIVPPDESQRAKSESYKLLKVQPELEPLPESAQGLDLQIMGSSLEERQESPKELLEETRIESPSDPRNGALPRAQQDTPRKSQKEPQTDKRAASKRESRSKTKRDRSSQRRSKSRSRSREKVLRQIRTMDMHKWWFHGLGYDMEYGREKSYSWILGPTSYDLVLDLIATFMQLFGYIRSLCGCANDRISVNETAAPSLKLNITQIQITVPHNKLSPSKGVKALEAKKHLKPKTTQHNKKVTIPSKLAPKNPASKSETLPPPLEFQKLQLEEEVATTLPKESTLPLETEMPETSVEDKCPTTSSVVNTPNPSQELKSETSPLEVPTASTEDNKPSSIPRTPNPSQELR